MPPVQARALRFERGRAGPGIVLQSGLEPLEGPDVPLAGRRVQLQDLGHLGVGQLLEMPQGDDLAVDRLHPVEGGLDLDLDLGPRDRLAGRSVMAEQLGRQRDRAGLRQRPFVQRDLAAGIPHRRPEVLAMDPHQPLPGHQPQPEEERHLALGQVSGQLLGDVEIRLLEHVGGVDPPLEPAVEPQPHHLPQPFAVAAEQLGQRRLSPSTARQISRSSSVSRTLPLSLTDILQTGKRARI